jgi:FKBP-type peptidyl-prolyl cis-trans isomerase FkpA
VTAFGNPCAKQKLPVFAEILSRIHFTTLWLCDIKTHFQLLSILNLYSHLCTLFWFMHKLFFSAVAGSMIFATLNLSCQTNNNNQAPPTQKEVRETMAEINKKLVERESERINGYISRRNLTVSETGTGLRIGHLLRTDGQKAKPGDRVLINYKISLLDGTVCYDSKVSGPKDFIVEGSEAESGLHEGIQHLRKGEKAILIIPPHLAHGLIGDENKIPPLSTIIYELELISIN